MASDAPPIYLIPGMTAEYPVFSRILPLLPNAQLVSFIARVSGESLTSYVARMADRFPADSYIAGVSFGGIVALEISRIVNPRGCILISSIRGPHQLPPWLRIWRMIGGRHSSAILKLLGGAAGFIPRPVHTASTMRISKLSGKSGAWHRWATSAILDWHPNPIPIEFPLLQIHGGADTTFPVRYVNPDVAVPAGRHALPMSHPVETANAIIAFTTRGLE